MPERWSRRSRPVPAPARSSLDGRMIDRPHLVQAQRILAAGEVKARALVSDRRACHESLSDS